MSWDFAPAFDAAHRAVLEGRKALVYVCPPAAWPVTYLFDHLSPASGHGLETLVLVPTANDALDVATALHEASTCRAPHALTGVKRTERLLEDQRVGTLVATPADALYLLRRSAIKSDRLVHIAVLWPETMPDAGGSDALEALMSDAPEAQRLVITAHETESSDFVGRHARRAPVAVQSRPPSQPAGTVRYAVVEPYARVNAARAALDTLAPKRALVWEPLRPDRWRELSDRGDVALATGPEVDAADLIIAADLPSKEVMTALHPLAGSMLILVRPHQVSYLERMVETAKPLRLRGDADQVRTDAARLRDELRKRLRNQDLTAGMLAVEPLLDEHDPVRLAAAALAALVSPEQPEPSDAEGPTNGGATWTHLFVTVGRRDRVSQGDIVKTLMTAANLGKTDVGRIELREKFSIVQVRPDVADDAIRGLTGEQIRGRRVTVRLDRHTSADTHRAE